MDSKHFQDVMDQFNTYKHIYVMQMTCDDCHNFELDGFFNENTTGKFEIEYLTIEHFDPTTLESNDVPQFSASALAGSQNSLVYAMIYPYHYFTPSLQLLTGMTQIQQLFLQHLDSWSNGLPSLSSLTSLRFLSLLDGNIGVVEPHTFNGLPDLQTLFMDRCNIYAMEPFAFSTLASLEQISLSFNNLTVVEEHTFQNLSSLHILNLGNSGIEEVLDNFEGADANIQILLHNNNIRTLPETTWKPLIEKILATVPAQGSIEVSNNPLDCGCDVKWLIVDLGLVDPRAPRLFNNARCADGSSLYDLDPDYLAFFCPDEPEMI